MRPDFGVYSHYPVLAAAVARTTGPVLELGCGWGSTPMLRAMCRVMNRKLESYDTDKEWADKFGVPVVQDQRWDLWEPLEKHYGVIFIDCSPGEIRRDLAVRLKDQATFQVLHDHEAGSAAAYYYETILEYFKYNETYRMLRPHTLILSNVEPFGLTAEETAIITE